MSMSRILIMVIMVYFIQYIINLISQIMSQLFPAEEIILSDNFDDGVVNENIWDTASDDPAGTITETNGVLRITMSGGYHQALITKQTYDLSNTELSIKLVSNGNNRSDLIVAFEKLLDGTEPAEAYRISHDRVDGKLYVKRKLWGETTEILKSSDLPSLPKTFKIRVEGDTVKFYMDNELLYSETWVFDSKTCYIWIFASGASYAPYYGDSDFDDFILKKIS